MSFIDINLLLQQWKNEGEEAPWHEISEEASDWFLESVFPMRLEETSFLSGEFFTHNHLWQGVYLAVVYDNDSKKYYAKLLTVQQFDDKRNLNINKVYTA